MRIEKDLTTILYEKMQAEQLRFHDHLVRQPPDVILRNAYEYAIRETILFCLEANDLPEKQCRALISLQNPLEAVYAKWESEDPRLVDEMLDVIKARADDKIREDYIRSRRDAR